MSMVDVSDTERKIAERMDPAAAGAVELSQQAGGLGFSNMGEAMQFAKIMAISGIAIRKHLRGNVGACMAITIQAVEWKLSPFAVANKSYEVNGQLAYESQLVQAVVLQRAPIKGRFGVDFTGEGDARRCTVTATLKDGGIVDYTSPEIGRIPIKNSPLWKNDPDQQLFYYSGRALCRRHFPDVLLGIYTPDELYDAMERRGPEHARDVTPVKQSANLGDPPHDPETGEIESNAADMMMAEDANAKALADPTGREAAKELAMQLEERAQAANGNPSHGRQAADAKAKDAGAEQVATSTAPASDPAVERVLDAGRAAATNGKGRYKRWENNLSAPDWDRVKDHAEELRDMAAKAGG